MTELLKETEKQWRNNNRSNHKLHRAEWLADLCCVETSTSSFRCSRTGTIQLQAVAANLGERENTSRSVSEKCSSFRENGKYDIVELGILEMTCKKISLGVVHNERGISNVRRLVFSA